MKLRQLDLKVATALRVPLVCARETHENDQVVIETMYSAPSESFTKKKKLVLYVTKDNRKKNAEKSDELCDNLIWPRSKRRRASIRTTLCWWWTTFWPRAPRVWLCTGWPPRLERAWQAWPSWWRNASRMVEEPSKSHLNPKDLLDLVAQGVKAMRTVQGLILRQIAVESGEDTS